MNHFTTLTEAMQALHKRGYTYEFSPHADYLTISGTDDVRVKGDEFMVDEFHRFEGASDPGDEMTLYAITTKMGKKGLFVQAQGTYSNEVSAELMAKFNVGERPTVNTEGSVKPIEPMI